MARNGALSFEGDAKLFTVDGLPSDQSHCIQLLIEIVFGRMDEVQTAPSGNGYRVTFPGWGESAQYYVSADGSIVTPTISRRGNFQSDITTWLVLIL